MNPLRIKPAWVSQVCCYLQLTDGEVATAKVVFVDAEYEDIIVDIITTSHPLMYKGPSNAAYTIPMVDVESATICPELIS